MQVFRGVGHRALSGLAHPGRGARAGHALTIGNFDGVHRGHQAMLALLQNEARHRGLPSCVMTFEPHPRDFFAAKSGRLESAPRRISTLRDKLAEIERCGVDRVVVMRFDDVFAALPPQQFIDRVLRDGLGARYVLVGDDFTFGARRAGTLCKAVEQGLAESTGQDAAALGAWSFQSAVLDLCRHDGIEPALQALRRAHPPGAMTAPVPAARRVAVGT